MERELPPCDKVPTAYDVLIASVYADAVNIRERSARDYAILNSTNILARRATNLVPHWHEYLEKRSRRG
jgi:hypothetical protein